MTNPCDEHLVTELKAEDITERIEPIGQHGSDVLKRLWI